MQHALMLLFTTASIFCACGLETGTVKKTRILQAEETENVPHELQEIARNYLIWADTANGFNYLPLISDTADLFYIGIDSLGVKRTVSKLEKSELFADAFVKKYLKLIHEVERQIREDNTDWISGEMPSTNFGGGTSPWCNCQDHLDWDKVIVEPIKLSDTTGQLVWKWGSLTENNYSGWRDFQYRFDARLQDDKWKITYLQGFGMIEVK